MGKVIGLQIKKAAPSKEGKPAKDNKTSKEGKPEGEK